MWRRFGSEVSIFSLWVQSCISNRGAKVLEFILHRCCKEPNDFHKLETKEAIGLLGVNKQCLRERLHYFEMFDHLVHHRMAGPRTLGDSKSFAAMRILSENRIAVCTSQLVHSNLPKAHAKSRNGVIELKCLAGMHMQVQVGNFFNTISNSSLKSM